MSFDKWATYLNSFRVAYVDDDRPWDVKKSGAPAEYWTALADIHASEVWIEEIPAVPPGATTAVVEVVTLAVEAHPTAVNPYNYVVFPVGGSMSNPQGSIINPAVFGDAYRPKLYRYDAGSGAYDDEILYTDACWWVLEMSTGVIQCQNTALPASDAPNVGKWRLECYRYIGQTLDSFVSSAGYINTVRDSTPTTTVSNVNTLTFDASYFTVTSPGAGEAQVALSSSVQQYGQFDYSTWLTGDPLTVNLSAPTRVISATQYPLMCVTINGVRQRYGALYDYTVSGAGTGVVTVTFTNARYTLKNNDEIGIGY